MRLPTRHPKLWTLLAVGLLACQAGETEVADEAAEPSATPAAGSVEVVADDYSFLAPDTIPSGWTTFRMVNQGAEPHFFLLNRLPEGRTIEDYGTDVGAAFDSVWSGLEGGSIGKAEAGAMLGRLLPAWYADVQLMGGVGLLAPGRTAETTARLEPGSYVMECYVKTAEGRFHSELGMVLPITVSTEVSDREAPAPDLSITLTNAELAVEGEPSAGEQTVAVHFEEHPEVGLGNDVHLVRLDGTTVEEVVPWMDWMNVDGLRAPAPAPFLGGTQEMPVGETSYFQAILEPGRYAWISETAAERLVREFSIDSIQ
jgi:hypothetical protein